ncbi:MAG: hypothetical protein ABIW82_18460 [Dokdonella sp.]
MKIATVLLLAVVMTCSGCATTQYRPLVDRGVSRGNYEDDVTDCQNLANQRPAGQQAAAGAAAGAVLGALLAVAVGLRGRDVADIAAYGAANGGINGAVVGSAQQQDIVERCMAGRGYNVVAGVTVP